MNDFIPDKFMSESAGRMKKSIIREILKLTQKPDMISFAGGLPAPESFPVSDLKEIVAEVLDEDGQTALQYGTTEGDTDLRKQLVNRHIKQGLNIDINNLIITTGSQQALDIIGRIFLDPGDHVICGLPSYLGGIGAFANYGAKLTGIPFDKDGIQPALVEKEIITLRQKGEKIKFIYVIPDFQNPAGITLPESRRKELIDIAVKYDLLIVEDCPYREIRFFGTNQKLIQEMDKSGRVISLFTFSKIFAPGFRIAWLIAANPIIEKIVMAKQSADLCSPTFDQKIIARYIEKGLLEKNLKSTIELYSNRRDKMIDCFERYMPDYVKWTEPEGGLFLFMTLPEHMDSSVLFEKAVEKGVAFVQGSVFYCNGKGQNTMRINFSFANLQAIEEGVKRLAKVIKEAY